MMKQLQIIRDVKLRIEFELSQKNFLQDIGDEYLIECKDFNVYITKDFWRVTLCIGGTPISELYPKTQFEIFTILATLKKYI
jgi:hypothetical protein